MSFVFHRRLRLLKVLLSLKFMVFIIVFWIFYINRHILFTILVPDLVEIGNSTKSIMVRKSANKYILLWSAYRYPPFPVLMYKDIFAKKNCTYQNCIVTTDRNYFRGDLTKFDAIALHGRKLIKYTTRPNQSSHGSHKSLHQKFIYVNQDSAWNYPICSFKFDGVFNWTMTYKLNSDIPIPYIQIRDMAGNIVGPKIDMQWKSNMSEVDNDVIRRLKKKKKAVAWFYPECHTSTKRENIYLANYLKNELKRYGYTVDTFGGCGTHRCKSDSACNKKLEEYYFFLAYEKSFAVDFVTSKVLRALWHYTVPIVYGGADYSRYGSCQPIICSYS